jgi:cyclase
MKPLFLLFLAISLRAQQPDPATAEIRVSHVQGNVYMVASAGGNMAVQLGKEGILLVDTQLAPLAPRILAEIRKLPNARGPIRFIINTHLHPDHTGGNEAFAKLSPRSGVEPLKIMAQTNVLGRMTKLPNLPEFGLPVDEYFTPQRDIHFNGEAIVLHHEPGAHTDGDTVVLFRGSDVVATGDIFTPAGYPFIDLANGGSIQGEINALNHILQLTVPAHTQEGGTYVIPGHGRICDEADVVEYRDMIVIIRDRIRDMMSKKMTLAQIQAAKPSRDYDGEYSKPNSFIKADAFIESIYKSLQQPGSPAK